MPTRKTSSDQSLHDLFVLKLKSLYDTELQITKALPKMAKSATDPELKQGFEEHLVQTQEQAKRLEQIFEILGTKPQKTKVEAIRGIAEDGAWLMKNVPKGEALDAALAGAAQYVEHYEMAGYGTAKEWAKLLGHAEAVKLLDQTLQEEEQTDKKLSKLAQSKLNKKVPTNPQ